MQQKIWSDDKFLLKERSSGERLAASRSTTSRVPRLLLRARATAEDYGILDAIPTAVAALESSRVGDQDLGLQLHAVLALICASAARAASLHRMPTRPGYL